MRKSSWIVLAICVVLSGCLALGYVLSRPSPENLTEDQARHVLAHMQIIHAFSFCSAIVTEGWEADVDAGVTYLAQELARFISENR